IRYGLASVPVPDTKPVALVMSVADSTTRLLAVKAYALVGPVFVASGQSEGGTSGAAREGTAPRGAITRTSDLPDHVRACVRVHPGGGRITQADPAARGRGDRLPAKRVLQVIPGGVRDEPLLDDLYCGRLGGERGQPGRVGSLLAGVELHHGAGRARGRTEGG